MFKQKIVNCDLNIPLGPKCREVCEAAFKIGYEIIAINTPVVAKNCLGQGKKVGKKRKLEERTGGALSAAAATTTTPSGGLPPPQNPDWIEQLKTLYPQGRILQRLTVIFSDVGDLQAVVNQPNSKLFDLLAVVPTNHDALQACIVSTTLIFDIISFDLEGPHWINKIRLNRQKGKVAAEKEVQFELTYAPSFHGDDPCENMIYTANRLTEDICTRRIKNIVISSGASKASELRSPKDVSSLGYLLGIDETTARHCIREHSCRTVSKSDVRKFGKTWVAFIPVSKEKDKGAASKKSFASKEKEISEKMSAGESVSATDAIKVSSSTEVQVQQQTKKSAFPNKKRKKF